MTSSSNRQLAQRLPKAELHLHIEGTLQPELLFSLAQKNKVGIPYATLEDVRAAYKFGNLDDFLALYYQGMSVLLHEEDFEELAYQYCKRANADGVVYAEPFFDPQGHLCRGVPLKTVYEGLRKGLARGETDFGLRSQLIFSFLRHLSEEECLALVKPNNNSDANHPYHTADVELANKLLAEKAFIAVGLDSSEMDHPPSKFVELFKYCRETLKVPHCVAHAGEEGPAQFIVDALDLLKVDRIDHGVACRNDAGVRDVLRARQIPLTVCPYSNVDLKVFASKAECAQSTLRLLRDGLLVTLNSDDPAYFGQGMYAAAQYEMLVDHCPDLKPEELKQLAANSFTAAFLPESEKQSYREAVEKAYTAINAN